MRDVSIIGIGQVPVGDLWEKPIYILAVEAMLAAIRDSKVEQIDSVYIGNMLSSTLAGQDSLAGLAADEREAVVNFDVPPLGDVEGRYLLSLLERFGGRHAPLAAALGIRTVVRKQRTVYLHKNVRIHLDAVDGLGTFLEFEAVMPDGAPDQASGGDFSSRPPRSFGGTGGLC